MSDQFCPRCGAYIRPGTAICPECGKKITDDNTIEYTDDKKMKMKITFPRRLLILLLIPVIGSLLYFGYAALQKKKAGFAETGSPKPTAGKEPGAVMSEPSAGPAAGAEAILELYPDGDPAYEDFDWYFVDVKNNGIPEGAVMMAASDLNGSWKYMFRFEITGSTVSYMEEIGYMNISQYGGKADLSPWPLYIKDGNGKIEREDPEEISYDPFVGTVDETGLHFTGNACTADIRLYYQYQGVQYAIGSMVTKTGYRTEVLMVRP